MTSSYKLMAVDVDGTLVNSQNELPEENRRALHQAHEAGMKVCLCTGRSLSETQRVIDALGLDSDVGIFVFGAIVSELPGGRTLHRTAINPELTRRITEFFHAQGFPILFCLDGYQQNPEFRLLPGTKHKEAIDHWRAQTPTPVVDLQPGEDIPTDPVRIGALDYPEHFEQTLAQLYEAFTTKELKCNAIFAPNYGLHVVECFAPQVNKWFGIRKIADELRIADEEIVAIGDDVNDVEMVRHAGLGVAMGNANIKVQAVAQWKVGTQDECGVAQAVEALLRDSSPSVGE